jgi:hypothetical protein
MTVAGSCETGRRNRQNDGAGLRTVVDRGFWVDGEREGKFGGKLGEEKCENEKKYKTGMALFT